jgi:hypothetical protein
MCMSPGGEQDATSPQIFLPITLSDNLGTKVPGDTGCNVINSTAYSENRKPATKVRRGGGEGGEGGGRRGRRGWVKRVSNPTLV